MKKVLVVVGPTAVGKSSLGVDLAKMFNGEIISGDSIQIYRQLNIGSAKIDDKQKKVVPHHLIDIKDLKDGFSVAEFQKEARSLIDVITKNGNLPIVVGGTGLYIKAVIYDYLFEDECKTNEDYDKFTNDELYEKLLKYDPISVEKIHINNRKRLIRALVMAENGKSKSMILAKQQHKLIYDCLIIGLTTNRDALYQQIDMRVDKMINDGLLDEINHLIIQDKDLFRRQAMQGIGYREWQDYYLGLKSQEEVVADIKKHSRQFAKRQYTWFNNQLTVDWFDINEIDYRTNIEAKVKRWLINGSI